ncbi:hypothetical protein K661_03303 [Piscirickettsia salmonis LF-89 = ATCC VR-1361]|nr:hypothetical protein K661_03303 [Piscirickettsia salmonis LF-89 = ATCC VR-1361]
MIGAIDPDCFIGATDFALNCCCVVKMTSYGLNGLPLS